MQEKFGIYLEVVTSSYLYFHWEFYCSKLAACDPYLLLNSTIPQMPILQKLSRRYTSPTLVISVIRPIITSRITVLLQMPLTDAFYPFHLRIITSTIYIERMAAWTRYLFCIPIASTVAIFVDSFVAHFEFQIVVVLNSWLRYKVRCSLG